VILEAMSSGLPVVALRAGGPGDIVRTDETGLLVDPDAPPERFAAALLGLVDDAELRRRLAAAARAYAASQTWDAIMNDLRAHYRHVLESDPAATLVSQE
jgi:glycosyltransferase involved in cell wall biosynthesis